MDDLVEITHLSKPMIGKVLNKAGIKSIKVYPPIALNHFEQPTSGEFGELYDLTSPTEGE